MNPTLRRAVTDGLHRARLLTTGPRPVNRAARRLARAALAPVELLLVGTAATGMALIEIGAAWQVRAVGVLGEYLLGHPSYWADLVGLQMERLGRFVPSPWLTWWRTDPYALGYPQAVAPLVSGIPDILLAEEDAAHAHAFGRCSCPAGVLLADCDEYNDAMAAVEEARARMTRTERAALRHYQWECGCEDAFATPEADCPDRRLAEEVDRAEVEAYAEQARRLRVQAQHDDYRIRPGDVAMWPAVAARPQPTAEEDLAAREAAVEALPVLIGGQS
ncbi:hypothetical protein AB0C76_33045 [Kitasatospora sp. NPDC048722]|uniref:hypothetical protein n=1 Tax=Kitasatospora sp. NPDC048722 TaxID=3155639 RepID=UPI0033CE9025